MAFCRYCGRPLEEGVRFCGNCGANAENSAERGAEYGAEQAQNMAQGMAQGAGNPYDPPNGGEYDPSDIANTKVVCAISYIGFLFFVPLVAYPDSRFAKFHANQALIVFLFSVLIRVVIPFCSGVLWMLPFLPNAAENLMNGALEFAEWGLPFAAGLYGFINALNGKAKEIPIIGKIKLMNK